MGMDKLAREARLAKKEKMSYGQWKAMQPIKEIPTKAKKCAWCGGLMVGNSVGGKYCSAECRDNVEAETVCEWCGKVFINATRRRRYCTKSCCALASYYRRKDQDGTAKD